MALVAGNNVALHQGGVAGPGAPGPMPPVIGKISSQIGNLHFVKWETGTQTQVVSAAATANLDLIASPNPAGQALVGRVVRPVVVGGAISDSYTGPIVRAYLRQADGAGPVSEMVVVRAQNDFYYEILQSAVAVVQTG